MAILHFNNVGVTAAVDADDMFEPAEAICSRLMGGKERVTRCFFSEDSFDRANALAPQLQSVWVALYQSKDLVVGSVYSSLNPMLYVME
jgi:hypothetical protein